MTATRYCRPVSTHQSMHPDSMSLFSLLTGQPMAAESTWTPHVDIKEEKEEFLVLADIPGVDPKQIEIDVDGNTLSVKGQRTLLREDKDKNSYYRIERRSGQFYREFTLPENVDGERITAEAKQGVLMIHIPKAKELKNQRRIQVATSE